MNIGDICKVIENDLMVKDNEKDVTISGKTVVVTGIYNSGMVSEESKYLRVRLTKAPESEFIIAKLSLKLLEHRTLRLKDMVWVTE